jgi:YIF1
MTLLLFPFPCLRTSTTPFPPLHLVIVPLLPCVVHRFTPEILATTFSSGVVTLLIHLLILKAGLYILPNPSACSFFDLIAYHGYTYVGYVVCGWVRVRVRDSLNFMAVISHSVFVSLYCFVCCGCPTTATAAAATRLLCSCSFSPGCSVVLTSLTVIFLPEWVQWLTWVITSLCMAKFMVGGQR